MKIITATYGCQYCDFTADSAKVVGKHEHTCEHNTKIKDTNAENKFKAEKAYKRKQIIESKSLTELNERLFSYLKEYYSSFSGGELIRNHLGEWHYPVKVNKSELSFSYAIRYGLKLLGISTKTEDYINLAPLLKEMNEINKITSTYSKEFKTHLNPLLNIYRKTSEIKEINNEIKEAQIKIDELLALRDSFKSKIEVLENSYIDKVKDEYNWIDYQAKLREIKSILDIK